MLKKLSQIKEVRQQVVDTHNQIEALNQQITSLNNSWFVNQLLDIEK